MTTHSIAQITTAQKSLETRWIELEAASKLLPEEQRKILNRSFRLLVDLDRELERAKTELSAIGGGK